MTDQGLLLFGTGVTFIVLAGVYVFLREGYERGPKQATHPIPIERRQLRDARRQT
jgi:hypothetical protein